ncbi:Benzoate 4-monooxygenase cytochrome P450 [Colletotrichum higginsianum IMI 349063]|uniref:Benzoate 4-monooxygenase cytochrome P450 n=1 Tax=Colletotrichum higginsianum (strain IMI 349063) TaxID=759273 RepID=A0A1B7Y0N9_COLHI|nr:Benzoate 4-monooxygenase cytochrome P450 [Colletotrichum higginsianum IMI 349063]OBR05553.1 Benzoate 4-monooxygenase cytochrome P450 [Colletotrichum higginsianum IMI 349063]
MHQNYPHSVRNQCEWNPASPRYYTREQDTREKLVLRQVRGIPGHINYYLTFCVKLRYTMPDAEAELRARGAWVSLRCMQPSIGTFSEGDHMKVSVLEPGSVDAWTSDTFFVHASAESALALSSTLQPTTGMALHFLPRTKEVIMCASHEKIDGHGMVMLLDQLCNLMAFPSPPMFEDQAGRLSPPLDVAAEIGSASLEMWNWTADVLKEWKARAAHPLFMTTDRPGPAVSEVNTALLTLSENDSAAISRSAALDSVSVNDLMNGALIMAVKQHGRFETGNWLGGIVKDARPLCKHPFNTRQHAAAVYFVTCPAYVENPKSILDAARQIRDQRLAFQQNPEALRIVQPILGITSVGGNQNQSRSQRPQKTSQAQVEYSGLGRLDGLLGQVHGDIEIFDLWMTPGKHKLIPSRLGNLDQGRHCGKRANTLAVDTTFGLNYIRLVTLSSVSFTFHNNSTQEMTPFMIRSEIQRAILSTCSGTRAKPTDPSRSGCKLLMGCYKRSIDGGNGN